MVNISGNTWKSGCLPTRQNLTQDSKRPSQHPEVRSKIWPFHQLDCNVKLPCKVDKHNQVWYSNSYNWHMVEHNQIARVRNSWAKIGNNNANKSKVMTYKHKILTTNRSKIKGYAQAPNKFQYGVWLESTESYKLRFLLQFDSINIPTSQTTFTLGQEKKKKI